MSNPATTIKSTTTHTLSHLLSKEATPCISNPIEHTNPNTAMTFSTLVLSKEPTQPNPKTSKIAIFCPQGSGTLRQQFVMIPGIAWYCMVLHGITWYCVVLHGIAWYCMALHGIA